MNVRDVDIVLRAIEVANATFDRVAHIVAPHYYQRQHTFPAVISVEFDHLLPARALDLLRINEGSFMFGFRQVYSYRALQFYLFTGFTDAIWFDKLYQIRRNGELELVATHPWWRMSRESVICCYAVCVAGERLVKHFVDVMSEHLEPDTREG